MPARTTSTVPVVKAALIAALQARLALGEPVHVAYAWDGTERTKLIFLDPPFPDTAGTGSEAIPVSKAGRVKRQEDYTIVVVVRVAQPLAGHASAADTEAEAYALFAEVENLLADDPNLGGIVGPTGILQVQDHSRLLVPLDKGWMAEITARINVTARLS